MRGEGNFATSIKAKTFISARKYCPHDQKSQGSSQPRARNTKKTFLFVPVLQKIYLRGNYIAFSCCSGLQLSSLSQAIKNKKNTRVLYQTWVRTNLATSNLARFLSPLLGLIHRLDLRKQREWNRKGD